MAQDKYVRNNRIAEALDLRGMKQIELCELTGISKSSLNAYVKQNWQPKQNAIAKMSSVLDVSEMWLAGYDVPMERDLRPMIIELTHDSELNGANRLVAYFRALNRADKDALLNIAEIMYNRYGDKE